MSKPANQIGERIIDLSHAISPETPSFPGDPAVEISILDRTDQADQLPRKNINCSRIAICVHCGTHMDAPFHFFGNGATIDEVPLGWCDGAALLVDLRGSLPIGQANAEIELSFFETYETELRRIPRVVFNTGWHHNWGKPGYFEDHPVIPEHASKRLVQWGVRLVGVDFPSVDRPPHAAHLALLGQGCIIIENLTNLDQIQRRVFHLTALPLPLAGGDGSPVRAMARVAP